MAISCPQARSGSGFSSIQIQYCESGEQFGNHCHLYGKRVFPPSGLKTLNNSTLADFTGLIPPSKPDSFRLADQPDWPFQQARREKI
jgi:hypothetical protein